MRRALYFSQQLVSLMREGLPLSTFEVGKYITKKNFYNKSYYVILTDIRLFLCICAQAYLNIIKLLSNTDSLSDKFKISQESSQEKIILLEIGSALLQIVGTFEIPFQTSLKQILRLALYFR